MQDEKNQQYYYNRETGQSVWTIGTTSERSIVVQPTSEASHFFYFRGKEASERALVALTFRRAYAETLSIERSWCSFARACRHVCAGGGGAQLPSRVFFSLFLRFAQTK